MFPTPQKLDLNAPATKGDLALVQGDVVVIKQDLAQVQTDLTSLSKEMHTEIVTKSEFSTFAVDVANLFKEVFQKMEENHQEVLNVLHELRAFRLDVDRRFADIAMNTPTNREHAQLERRVTHLEKKTGFALN